MFDVMKVPMSNVTKWKVLLPKVLLPRFLLPKLRSPGACLLAALLIGVTGNAHAALVVDRGLPNSNINQAAGDDRSNAAWGFEDDDGLAIDFLVGDDFNLGSGNWRIDRLSLWTLGGEATLGDRFNSISLFLGREAEGDGIPVVASANLNGNNSDNPDVSVSQVQYPGTSQSYQGMVEDGFLNIWQIDFFNLGLFNPGQQLFALAGEAGEDSLPTYTHASSAALSGNPQDGADNRYRWFSGNASSAFITPGGFFDTADSGWDKSSDINIQVEATDMATTVPEPSVLLLLSLGLFGLFFANSLSPRRLKHRQAKP